MTLTDAWKVQQIEFLRRRTIPQLIRLVEATSRIISEFENEQRRSQNPDLPVPLVVQKAHILSHAANEFRLHRQQTDEKRAEDIDPYDLVGVAEENRPPGSDFGTIVYAGGRRVNMPA